MGKDDLEVVIDVAIGKQGVFFKQMNTVWVDENGCIYTADKKRLLRVAGVKRYRILEGCEDTDEHAFDDCKVLESLYVPYTFSDEAFDALMNSCAADNGIGNICHWDRPYLDEVYDVNDYWYDENEAITDEQGVMYANEGRRLITATKPRLIGKEYFVPDGVLTICDGAFGFCEDYVVLSVPRSIKVIGDYIFGQESGKIVIRD